MAPKLWNDEAVDILLEEITVRKVKNIIKVNTRELFNIHLCTLSLCIFQATLFGKFSSSVTKEKKEAEWDDITAMVRLLCPDMHVQTKKQAQKHWQNMLSDVKTDNSKYLASLRGTGKLENKLNMIFINIM